jgi:hypothetical protein
MRHGEKSFLSIVLLFAWGVGVCFAGNEEDLKVSVHGYSAYETGQIVSGDDGTSPVSHVWQHMVLGGFTLNAGIGDRIVARVGLEGQMWNPYEAAQNDFAYRRRYFNIYLNESQGIYSFGNPENPFLQLGVGYFTFKYNNDVRDLGEYLFRSMTYPGFLFTTFDFSAARLLGARLSSTLFKDALHQDLLFTSSSEMYPFYDFSLSYIASYRFARLVEIGCGVDFDRLLSVNSNKTTPRFDVNGDINRNDMYVDSSSGVKDTTFYSFAGTKLMGRFSIDLKALLPFDFFGKEDLKIYGELAVLGVKDYPGYYDDIWTRIPRMIGINVPAFKLLDVLSVEGEYYGCTYPTNYSNVESLGVPTPFSLPFNWDKSQYREDDWKYAVYAKRTFWKHASFTVLVARDHFRTLFKDGHENFPEFFKQKKDMYFMLKGMINF